MQTMLQRLIGEDIAVDWKPGMNPWTVWIDSSQVDQIRINLCVNARDAIGGVGKISLETANILVDADYCRVNPETLFARRSGKQGATSNGAVFRRKLTIHPRCLRLVINNYINA